MPLTSGSRLGPYEIVSPVGSGGMGEVYKARDTRLDRVVALKVIQTQIAATPEFRERFDREAKAISALDHPHICTLYDVGHESGAEFLVMQFLEGETLADRLSRAGKPRSDVSRPSSGGTTSVTSMATVSRGPIPLETTLKYAAEIAAALDAAHRRGIVHRDLKPGNVMLTKAGTKLLDFGLAKLAAEEAGTPGLGDGATRTSPLTGQGAILGTLYYMSPEQLEGRAVDAWSDIFSFGAVLYEMLTGRRAFEGDSQAGTIAAIIGGDPPALGELADIKTRLPVVAHRALDRLLHKCLAKNPDDRWHSAADLSDELNWINEERLRAVAEPAGAPATNAPQPHSRGRERIWMAVAAIAALIAVATALWLFPRPADPPAPITFTAAAPDGEVLASGPGSLALSPDGRKLAFATGAGESLRLWVRSLDALDARPIERVTGAWQPFWSPDGRFIGYAGSGGPAPMRRVDLAGGAPLQIGGETIGRGAWGAAGVILFSADNKLYSVPEGGGQPTVVMEPDPAQKEASLNWPLFLTDGRRYVFCARSGDPSRSGLYLATLGSPARTPLASGVLSSVEYAQGHLFYQQQGTLMALPFDEARGTVTGEATRLIENIRFNAVNGRAAFSVSPTGVLAYRTGESGFDIGARQITWLDASGKPISTVGGPAVYDSAAVSPDGRQLAVVEDNPDPGTRVIYLFDQRGLRTRFSPGSGEEFRPIWAPDGSSLVFASIRDGRNGLYRRAAGGAATSEELLFASTEALTPTAFSADGTKLLFTLGRPGSRRVWVLPVDVSDRKPVEAFPGMTADVGFAAFSPDAKWIVYSAREGTTGEEVYAYIQPFPADGRRIRISTTTGYQPRWTADQRRIIYRTFDGTLESVPLTASGGTLVPGAATKLFAARKIGRLNWNWDMTERGDRFLIVVPPERESEQQPPPITVIVNWTSTLPRK